MEYAYSPYSQQKQEKKKGGRSLKIKLPKGVKKWAGIIVGIIVLTFFIFYLMLGELRFFANHFLGLTFFSKDYVVILQNDYELRPGGGFITGYGEISTFMGFPGDVTFKNSYDIDTKSYVTPPYPHEELLKNEWYQGYTFRDANWDPDFPGAAEELIKFYQEKFPDKDVDGLIVVNFSLIEKMIDEFGGISLNGKQLTKNNLFSELEFEVNNIDRHDVDALENRKDILGELAIQLIGKAKRHPFKTRDLFVDGLNNKNIYLWLKNERLENKLIEKSWANAMAPLERSDFLTVNLANLGSKKADRYVQTEVHYYANITKELPEITTEVTIRYPGFTNTYSDNYKGYLRLYIPKGADVLQLPLDSQEQGEGEFKMIGTKIILPAGSKTSLSYTYTLPRNTFLHDQYQLRLIKQSGSEAFYKLTVETAEGKLMESDDFDTRENRALFMGKLENDKDLAVKILPDTTPPYPIEQEFEDLTRINIIWNEPMDPATANNPQNFSIADLNKNNENTDEVNVIYTELIQPNVIQLEVEGVTDQTLESYRIDLKGLKDQTGIQILPDPKSITVVQRIKPKSEVPEIRLGEIPDTAPVETPAIE
ncbi:DUF4012 domain-containing protein [Candidatus Peregrinibacteria bacterium]|nr:DUF4012 domain-containing protein [Candidatus Peregrinibacteria bacterium]